MGTSPEPFTEQIRAQLREGAASSARAVVPLVQKLIQPRGVLDVGCGEGWWGSEFVAQGCNVMGIDSPDLSKPPTIQFRARDLELPGALTVSRWDLALCLEVAEHLSPERAEGFVGELCVAAQTILFSAAIPGQGGVGHLNEQWPDYWVDLFAKYGYECSGALRWRFWRDERVENWYRQNLMVASCVPATLPELFDTPLRPMWPVVHPILFEARLPDDGD